MLRIILAGGGRSTGIAAAIMALLVGAGLFIPVTAQAAMGQELWAAPVTLNGGPVVSPSGDIISTGCDPVTIPDPAVRVIRRDGTTAWSAPTKTCTAAVGDSAGVTYTHIGEDVRAIGPTGVTLWSSTTQGYQPSLFALGANGSLYVSAWNGLTDKIYAFDRRTGARTFESTNYSGGIFALRTFASGFSLDHGNANVEYWDYDGKKLGTYATGIGRAPTPVSDYKGNMYFVGYTSEGPCPGSVKAVKIASAGVAWSWNSPVLNGCKIGAFAATTDGGIVLLQDLANAPGTQVTSISPTGATRWTRHLPEDYRDVAVDTKGIVVLSSSSFPYTCGQWQCRGLHTEFVDQATGSEALPALDGRRDDGGSNSASWSQPAIDAGRLYVVRSGPAYSDSPVIAAFDVPGLSGDYRNSPIGDLAAPAPHTFKYVALGDSYSAGEGVGPYWEPSSRCHRSKQAYAHFVQQPGRPDITLFKHAKSGLAKWGFQACSGATTTNLLPKSQGGKSQIGYGEPLTQLELDRSLDRNNNNDLPVDAETDLVTLTIGGNDLKFTEVLRRCYLFANDCTQGSFEGRKPLPQVLAERRSLAANNLRSILQTIRERTQHGRILLLGYPQIFPQSSGEQNCGKLAQGQFKIPLGINASFGLKVSLGFSQKEQNYLRQATSELNQTLAAVATEKGAEFVAVDMIFSGHEICGDRGEWINAGSPGTTGFPVDSASFHPNASGHLLGYAAAINVHLNGPGF
jgi:lysophospholipase L1-like esterase